MASTADINAMLSQLEALKSGGSVADLRPRFPLVGASFTLLCVEPEHGWTQDGEKPDGSPRWKQDGYKLDETGERVSCVLTLRVMDGDGRSEGSCQLTEWIAIDSIGNLSSALGGRITLKNPRIVCVNRSVKNRKGFVEERFWWQLEHDGIEL